jgi:hypothetical protein
VGAVPRRKADRGASKYFFFEKKKQKTFDYFGFGLPGATEANSQSFLVLFFKKEPLSAACLGIGATPTPGRFSAPAVPAVVA